MCKAMLCRRKEWLLYGAVEPLYHWQGISSTLHIYTLLSLGAFLLYVLLCFLFCCLWSFKVWFAL